MNDDKWLERLSSGRFYDLCSDKDIVKLRNFYMSQRALSRELLDGKPLGICKTITSGSDPLLGIRLVDQAKCITSEDVDSKEMST